MNITEGIDIAKNTNDKEINAIIYIINLDRALDRRKSVQKELLKTDIAFKFISAVDKNNINLANYKIRNKYKRPLIPAEIACYLSHLKVKELFLKSSYDFAIILEDDIKLLDDFNSLVKKTIIQHKSLSKENQWDVLKLPSFGKKKMHKLFSIDNNYNVYGGSVAITTMAAIWTRKGVKQFMEKTIIENEAIINMPIDCEIQRPWKYDLKIYNINPPVVAAKDFESQIRAQKKLNSRLFKRVNYEFQRLFPRIYLYIRTGILEKNK